MAGTSSVEGDSASEVARHKENLSWGVADFVGKYHLSRMTAMSNPIPGSAIRIERERQTLREKRANSLHMVMSEIKARRKLKVKTRTRQAAITTRVKVEATVGEKIDSAQRMFENVASTKKRKISASQHTPDEEFHAFLGHIETDNIYQVKASLRDREQAFRLVNTAEERHLDTALHRAVSLGFVEMTRLLLDAGADVDAANTIGDAPLHCCWQFWRNDASKYMTWKKSPHMITTPQQQETFKAMDKHVNTTVDLLHLLIQNGADVDLRRNNGESALHTAARKGPLQAVWVLLLSKATHDALDDRLFTPELAATRAGRKEHVALLANWSVVKQKYLDSEFVQEWMYFLCDSDPQLGTNPRGSEVVAQTKIEEYEESTAVRAQGGHTLIDEIITGPVLSLKERKQARIAESPVDAVSPAPSPSSMASGVGTAGTTRTGGGSPSFPGKEIALEGAQSEEDCSGSVGRRPMSKLGKGIDVFLAEARDRSCSAIATRGAGQQAAYVSLMVKENLEKRRNRWPRGRNNAKKSTGSDLRGSDSDPFGRPMTTMQRRLAAAWEIAEDGALEGPLLRPATSSVILTTSKKATKKSTGLALHPYYGRQLLTQSDLDQRERAAGIKPTATPCAQRSPRADNVSGSRAICTFKKRTAFNDTKLLPGPKDPSTSLRELGRLHAMHPVMLRRKMHERPSCQFQERRKHNENVYCSTLENYSPTAWNGFSVHEPLLPVRRLQ